MTKVMSATNARKDIFNLIDETASTHEPIIITGKRNNAVMVSQEDWNAIQETLYLNSIPNVKESILEGMDTPVEECSEDLEW
ncbi:MAG: type II toxin-antitoxin system Phd/YefM family antitoxin [Campylobacterota bacterium]|nr:type II toxin-antitoxin system Phd/YefM family antitoxin [Campylobacterota bacterium]